MYPPPNNPPVPSGPRLSPKTGEILIALEAVRERIEHLDSLIEELYQIFEPVLSCPVPEKTEDGPNANAIPLSTCSLSNGLVNVTTRLDTINSRLWSLKTRCQL